MNIYILDSALQRVGVIDYYRSIIWTRRYYSPGDFELCVEASAENISLLQKGRYVCRAIDYDANTGSYTSVMIIEYIQITTSYEDGDTLLVQGRDLKSILHKRIVWSQTVLSSTLENNIRTVLTQNFINPSVAARKISNFTLGSTIGGTSSVQIQLTGDNIGEWLTEILTANELGYDMQLTNGNFVFSLCRGVDRSYDQSTNPYVVFSPTFENLLSSDYVSDDKEARNVALIAGEGEGRARKTATAGASASSGMARSELFVDARDMSTDTEDGTLTPAEYTAQLVTRGLEALSECQSIEVFEGQIDAETNFVYGTDYYLGDKVEIINEYGVQLSGRIIEVIDSEDESGRTIIPTFSTGGTTT